MASALKCIFSLIFISLALFFFNSHLLSTPYEPKLNNEVSTNYIRSRFRSLLGLQNRNFRTKAPHFTGPSPSPAPSQADRKPLSATPFHVKDGAPTRASSHHTHMSPIQISSNDKHDKGKTVIVIICLSLIILVMVISLVLFLLFKRQDSKNRQGKHKKVSIDPGPELFYLNSLTHFIDIHDSDRVKMSSEVMQMERNIVCSPPPCHGANEEVIVRCQGDGTSCSDEETLSFHSARALELSELPQYQLQASNSPSNSSYGSTSPMQKTNLRKIRFVTPSTQDQEADAIQKSHTVMKSKFSYDMGIPSISHPKLSFLSSKYSQFLSSNAFKSHDSSQSGNIGERLPSNSDPNFEIPSCSQEVQPSKGISFSPLKYSLPPESISENPNCSASTNASSNSSDIHLPAISPPRVSFIHSSMPNSVSNSTEVHSANVTHSKNGNVPKPPPLPPPPPPPPPPPVRKNIMHQRPCRDGRFWPSPSRPMMQMEQTGSATSTLPKLKPLHWDKVRAAPDRTMVWDKIRLSSFEFDENMIESLFGYNSKSVVKHEEAKSKSKSPSPSKHVLEHKRLQNITILLKALNATTDQVSHAITLGSGLSAQQLEALVKMAPTREEEENLAKYQDDVDELDPAEKFVKEVLRIPFAFAKMEVMLYKETFQDEVSHLRNSFSVLDEACKELKSSKLFLRLLEAVLKTGNRMNVGTTRGGARAFKLDALLKLGDVKGTDGRTTLLHFVVQEINKPKPGEEKVDKEISGLDLVSGLSTELCNVKKTASVDLDVIAGSVQNLSLGLCKLKQLVQSDLCVDELNLIFLQSMKRFMQEAEEVIEELKKEENAVLMHVREITEYYHGDLGKEEANPLRIFVIVRDFLGLLDRVCKELKQPKMHSASGAQLVMLNR